MTARKRSRGGERRSITHNSITRMLEERQQMWVLYERVAGIAPYTGTPDPKTLTEFVEILIDYISAAHFGLYQRIVSGTERRKSVRDLARDLYPRIAESTEAAVAFNDKYGDTPPESPSEELSSALSDLGEDLATRIELEDRLIETLLAEDRRRA